MKLQWDPACMPPPTQQAEIEAAVREDIAKHGWTSPQIMAFHHCYLHGDRRGPYVFITDQLGSDAYHCRYRVPVNG